MLLTSLPIESFEQVFEAKVFLQKTFASNTIFEWYVCRWEIEVFFKVLKSGCKVEKLRLEAIDRIKPCLAIYLIIAWRTLFVTKFGRIYPDLDCDLIFTKEEWFRGKSFFSKTFASKAVHIVIKQTSPPSSPPSISEMLDMIARLGGHLGRKHDGPPGPQSIWIGLQRMRDFVMLYEAIKKTQQADPYNIPQGI